MPVFQKFSEWEKRVLNIISKALTSQELDSLKPDDLDDLQGRILQSLLSQGSISTSTVQHYYKQVISKGEK